MTRFGDFAPLCEHVPSYILCNIFFRQVSPYSFSSSALLDECILRLQLQDQSPGTLSGLSADPSSAPVGVNPECGIPQIHHGGSPGNAANIIACALSFLVSVYLMRWATRRRAAVGELLLSSMITMNPPPNLPTNQQIKANFFCGYIGRVEFRFLLGVYAATLLLNLLTSGSFIEQGSPALVILTAIHAGKSVNTESSH